MGGLVGLCTDSRKPPITKGALVTKQEINRIQTKITEVLCESRSNMMDTFEATLGQSKSWPQLRSILLRTFGDRGIPLKIDEILNNEYDSNWGEE